MIGMGALNDGALRRAYFRNRSIDRVLNHRRYRGIRPTDLFIASYPRSGTTWLRFLLFECLTGAPSDFVSVNRAIPYVGEHGRAPGLLPNGGRLIMTHEAHLKGVRSAIYVVRDPRSVVLSEYLFQLRTGLFDGSFDHFFEAFIAGRANPYGAWDRHAAMWTESAMATEGRLHVVRFEDLRNDTSSELTRILSLLGVGSDGSVIDDVIAHNALAQMRAKEDAAPLGAFGPCARPDIRFVNSGSLTDWKNSLRQDQAQRITNEFRTSLQALRYDVSPIERESTVEAPYAVIGPGAEQPPQTDEPLKVLFIAGWDRSGSTLLDNLLGQIDGFFSTGELRYIWERGELMGGRCGCGQRVTECEIWAAVLEKLHEDGATPDAATIVRWQDRVALFRRTFSLLNLTPSGARDHPMLQAYLDLTRRLYSSIAEVTGARVVVDSSKRPSDAAILNLVPGLQLHVIHLVRDPRAVAYSWGKRRPDMDRHGVFRSSAYWVAWNLGSEALRRRIPERSILVRYEDFVKEPRRHLQRILALVSEDPAKAPSNQDGTFEVSTTHTVSGNPARFRHGPIKVAPDDQWLDRLGTPRKVAATMTSLPLLRRYGYEIRVPGTGAVLSAQSAQPRARVVSVLAKVPRLAASRRRVVVLCYHSVHPSEEFPERTPPDLFERHMEWLRSECNVVPFTQITACASGDSVRPTVALTFDDGYADNYTHALPILLRLDMPATFFVSTGLIERHPEFIYDQSWHGWRSEGSTLTWEQIVDMRRSGMEIGSHGHSHRVLGSLTDGEVSLDLSTSKRIIEDRLGEQIVSMAYPRGRPRRDFSLRTTRIARTVGFERGAAILLRGVSTGDGQMRIPRFPIATDPADLLRAKVLGRTDLFGMVQEGAPLWMLRRFGQ